MTLSLVGTGQVLPPNPLTIILKRLMLTGYPLRVHNKRAVVRHMFFDPEDIKYFRPIELHTKMGLRGHIKNSLGTHGLMKCVFNDYLKPNDTICLPLFKRIYPKWFDASWNPKDAGFETEKEIYLKEKKATKEEIEEDKDEEMDN
jgi:pre-rRNA-processing protein TSR1